MKEHVWVAAVVVGVGAIGYAGFRVQRGASEPTTAPSSAAAAETLPEFYADEHQRWVNGEPQSLAAQRGHPVLIEVWAPGCNACLASIPAVHALESAHEAHGLRVIGVTRFGKNDFERERISSVAKKHDFHAPTFLDFERSWTEAGNMAMNPTFVLLDKEGRVAFRSVGQLTEGDDDFAAMSKLIAAM
jgi:thiol-disulfide isomerase/thioredoxin